MAIEPGPCPPEAGCPPATEIVCIKADKVFDSCFQSDQVTVSSIFELPLIAPLTAATYTCTVTAGPATIAAGPPNTAGCVEAVIMAPFTVAFAASNPDILIPSASGQCTAIANLYAPSGTELAVESNQTCSPVTAVVVSVQEVPIIQVTTIVTCCIVAKSTLTVQLLVPSYGPCPIPVCATQGLICPPTAPIQQFPSPCR